MIKWKNPKELPSKDTVIFIKDNEIGIGDWDDCQHGCWEFHYDREDNGNNIGQCIDSITNLRETQDIWGKCEDKNCIDLADTQGWIYAYELLKDYKGE